ncbi:carbohydrate ABC transporter substrate-binding protein [Romeria aff. gracilis LEGE 07310]|uniref:Carbohydrate ABC transporter substrate-binding protein n=1 Tax=Vasconcelosia minhoensis LEGE 07310 TaxID=915328 RepID=A0A8J7AT14_9CYAN|nr:ABC transporter substrate-binding protein [Romeria gracilis]MBE9079905.1 carbohydrate ABC transporter substrate-binding protein [Romeria aff. gracilis LEGE 07310]
MNNPIRRGLTLGLSLTLLLSACGGDETAGGGENSVTVLGVIVGDQQEKLEEALAPFEEETGIDVIYEGTDAFATLLQVRAESGDAPDIAMFPQTGLMDDFARAGQLIPITEFIDEATLQDAYPENWLELATVEGEMYGIWYRASVKSLVWYRPSEFEAAGYDVPETWDELIALSDQIVADGGTPWCIGLESGESTGWPGTDWVEDIMLRTAGPEGYDQWVNHEIPFDAEPVQNAFERFGDIILNPDYVVGGTVGAISTPFGDSPQGLFTDPPNCYLHRQANFIASFFPAAAELGEDVDVFLLPAIDEQYGVPVLVAGDIFSMFNDTPAARALMEYLATPEPHEIWAGRGGFLSPHLQVSPDAYPDPVSQKEAEFLANAETIRFDGSDSMPQAVGTGTFWSGIVDYVAGTPADEVLSDIEQSWPEE